MSLLDIHVLGSPILRVETQIVTDITDDLRRLAEDMFETMHAAHGIGLAAPQVGRDERLAVVEVDDQRLVIINPELVAESGEAVDEEGCLSIPEVYGDVTRAAQVRVQATNLDGVRYEVAASGLLARCLQHEIDHLHGVLFIDNIGTIGRMASWEKERTKYPDNLRRLPTEPPSDATADLPPASRSGRRAGA